MNAERETSLTKAVSKLDIQCDNAERMMGTGRLPRIAGKALIKNAREVVTEYYAWQRSLEEKQAQ